MARADAAARVAVEVLVEGNVIAEVRIALKAFDIAEDGAITGQLVAQHESRYSAGELVRDLTNRHHVAGARRALDTKIIAVIAVELAQRFDELIVHRHPDRSAPVAVAAE